MKKYTLSCLLLILCLCLLNQAQAQEKNPFLNLISAELQKPTLEYARGIGIKADHIWKEQKHSLLMSGLMLSILPRPGASPATSGDLRENNVSFRLQLHTGYEWRLGAKKRWYTFAEGFVGLRSYLITGNLNHQDLGLDRDFSAFTLKGDFGYRLGLGYRIARKWGIQAGLTGSLIELNHPLGPHTGLLAWGPDSMGMLTLGLRYDIAEDRAAGRQAREKE